MKQNKEINKAGRKRVRRNRSTEILEATTTLFAEKGFQGTSLAMVAEAVGLTEPGVLHYFPSKVHLLQGVLEYRDAKYFEQYKELIDREIEDVSEIFGQLQGFWTEQAKEPALIQLFLVLVGESISEGHPSHDFFVDRYRRGREIYVQQFLKSQISADVNFEELTNVIMAVTDGLYIQWLLDPDAVDLAATFKMFSRIVLTYLEKPGEG